MARCTVNTPLISEFMTWTISEERPGGLKRRAAQKHAERESGLWKRFLLTRGVPSSAVARVIEARSALEIERACLDDWNALRGAAHAESNVSAKNALLRNAGVALQNYREAVKIRVEEDEREGRLVSCTVMDRILEDLVQPLRAVFDGMPAELGPRTNLADPGFAAEAVREWRQQRVHPVLERLSAALVSRSGNGLNVAGRIPNGGAGDDGDTGNVEVRA